MDFKIVIFASLSILIQITSAAVLAKIEDFDPAPQYTFAYDVQDAVTGDSKAQFETRNGDIVQGSYSLIEADGTRRIVDYTADPVNGFNAVVNREPAVAFAPVVTKTLPLVTKTVPVTTVSRTGPITAVVSRTLPVAVKAVAPSPIFVRTFISNPIIERKVPSPVSVTPAVVSGRVIISPGGFPTVAKISNSDAKIATLSAPLTYAAAGYRI